MKQCRNCVYWRQAGTWMGNCIKHPSPKPRWSQSADPTTSGCQDYVDRYAVTSAKEE